MKAYVLLGVALLLGSAGCAVRASVPGGSFSARGGEWSYYGHRRRPYEYRERPWARPYPRPRPPCDDAY